MAICSWNIKKPCVSSVTDLTVSLRYLMECGFSLASTYCLSTPAESGPGRYIEVIADMSMMERGLACFANFCAPASVILLDLSECRFFNIVVSLEN